MKDIPEIYIPTFKRVTTALAKILKKSLIREEDTYLFDADEYDADDIASHETHVEKYWQKLTKGKNLTQKEKQTLLFTFLAGEKPCTSITEKQAIKMLDYLTRNTPEYERSIRDFIENNIPYPHHESILNEWSSLSKEMSTLYKKDTSLDIKMWILKEAGCNFPEPKEKTKK